jgi:hypothetical protein
MMAKSDWVRVWIEQELENKRWWQSQMEFMCESSKRSKRVGKKLQLQKSNSYMTLMHALKYGTDKWLKLGTHKSKISAKYPFCHHHPPPDSSLTFKAKKFNKVIDPCIFQYPFVGLQHWIQLLEVLPY